MLDKAGIQYFHMTEFTSCTGQFASWKDRDCKPDESRRRPCLQRLIDITVTYAEQSFAAGVLLRDWDRCNRLYELEEEEFLPYALCSWVCIDCVYGWCEAKNYERSQALFILEDGDLDKGHLETRVKREFGIRLHFGGKTREPNGPSVLPLQAADFAAWHVRRLL